MRIRSWMGVMCAAIAATACGAEGSKSASAAEKGAPPATILEIGHMIGVPRPYTGPTNAIRGIPGGGLPWVIAKGEATLREDGLLKVEVEGLVFNPDDAVVISRGLAGRNNVPGFKAIVSCQTVQQTDAGPVAAISNVETAVAPATQGLASEGGGNAEIEQMLTLPSPCIAPLVFVTSPAGAWFATSGM